MKITIDFEEGKGLELNVEGEVSRVDIVGVLETAKFLVLNPNAKGKEDSKEEVHEVQ